MLPLFIAEGRLGKGELRQSLYLLSLSRLADGQQFVSSAWRANGLKEMRLEAHLRPILELFVFILLVLTSSFNNLQ